ncbi:hypothetical protein BaOVIS_017300 [Babesia ovis]|uniref:Uncharacterized protein n=1 Tax=Babesia ovis TaxID=5869 RepID=A0A9W5WUW1_BABOV|nr:hypothetical protein BaOVIS_017300 [Babesia ovis]
MILNANRVAADNFREVMDASTFKQISQDSGTNSEACQAINKLWVRDFINELNLYKMDYIVHRYQSASMQLLKEPMDDTVFLDIGFDEPLDKMVTYFWAYHLKQAYDVFMHNASQMHTKWEKLKEKINTSTTASE